MIPYRPGDQITRKSRHRGVEFVVKMGLEQQQWRVHRIDIPSIGDIQPDNMVAGDLFGAFDEAELSACMRIAEALDASAQQAPLPDVSMEGAAASCARPGLSAPRRMLTPRR
ncbi:hypothetical protein [Oleiagrimonas sp. C23AA]|uniref:hypothetical protein n=1 Tax=Oleiagrimonas sp. C23AA TaxID=2719047 RepID=UPI00142002C7|nr:hypothetical protein [Oleiagrimonas sp. C23AA]NII09951.1 hypothetical protein [Oleiagrimonas sp. C23AA]